MKKTIVAIVVMILNSWSAFAEETLSLTVIDQNFNSTDRIIIDQDAIKRSRANNLAQVLASQANIVIASSNFQPNSVFIRGGDSSHVLFIVDGVPTYDASTIQKTINLSGMNLASIKRIEILKGSQSVLYGGQALSAVIKIYTIPNEFKNSEKIMVQSGTNISEGSIGFDRQVTENFLISLNSRYKTAENASPVLDSSEKYSQTTGTADLALVYKINERNRAFLKVSFLDDANTVPTTVGQDVKAVDTKDFKFGTGNFATTASFTKSDTFSISIASQKSRRQFFQEVIAQPMKNLISII